MPCPSLTGEKGEVSPRTNPEPQKALQKGGRAGNSARTSQKGAKHHARSPSLPTGTTVLRKCVASTLRVSVRDRPPIANSSTIRLAVSSAKAVVSMVRVAITPTFRVPCQRRPWTREPRPREVSRKPRRRHLQRDPPEEMLEGGEEGALHHAETASPNLEPW